MNSSHPFQVSDLRSLALDSKKRKKKKSKDYIYSPKWFRIFCAQLLGPWADGLWSAKFWGRRDTNGESRHDFHVIIAFVWFLFCFSGKRIWTRCCGLTVDQPESEVVTCDLWVWTVSAFTVWKRWIWALFEVVGPTLWLGSFRAIQKRGDWIWKRKKKKKENFKIKRFLMSFNNLYPKWCAFFISILSLWYKF